jgi:flagellar export protein FliJ
MSKFRFRAQAALDLRLREWQSAQRDQARAQQVRELAARAVEKAAEALAAAQQAGAEQAQSRRTATELQWYRFWILRLEHERRGAQTTLAAREADVAKASAACEQARQRHETLDRLRQKTQRAHEQKEADAERKMIDELATTRFNIDKRGTRLEPAPAARRSD